MWVAEAGDESVEVEFSEGGFRGGDAVDAVGSIEGAPGLDEAAECVVGSDGGVIRVQGVLGDGADGVAVGEEPLLDAVAVVGDSRRGRDGVFHDLE